MAYEEAGQSIKELTGERALLVAVMKRALADAQGIRLGSDGPPTNRHIQREARKWFRDKLKAHYPAFGWGWIVETLGLPRRFVTQIEQAAKTECVANNMQIAWCGLFFDEPERATVSFESDKD